MKIDSLKNGIVLDHITAGNSMEIYRTMRLDRLDCSVAMIMNARSTQMGRKDIIKIADFTELNMEVLGVIDPGVTVNIIKDGKLVEKKHVELPERIFNVLQCKNPRCITVSERQLRSEFVLTNRDKKVYSCAYCDTKYHR